MSVVIPAESADPPPSANARKFPEPTRPFEAAPATGRSKLPVIRRRGGEAGTWHGGVALVSLALATWVTGGIWQDPQLHVLAGNRNDHMLFEWLLGYGAHVVQHGSNPFFTDLLNAPLGVNLASNTSITVYAVVFAPVTMLAGPQVSFVLLLTLNLAGSAIAWYAFLLRHLVRSRAAASLAGMFCGFAPGFVSHANGHLNWTAGWIAPVLVWRVISLQERGRWLRNGTVLGVLVSVAFSIAAEALFFTALACAVFLVAWALPRATRTRARAALPTMLTGLTVTALVSAALLAYPLYMHFDGPQSFDAAAFDQGRYAEDVLAYLGYSDRSLAGWAGLSVGVAPNPAEQTSFFGPPLVFLLLAALVPLWRRSDPARQATLGALCTVGTIFVLLSLGPRLKFHRNETDIWLPYASLGEWPLFEAAMPGRLALVVTCIVGILLALAADRLLARPPGAAGARTLWAAGFAVALIPLFPMPLLWTERSPEPAFIAHGTWQRYVSVGGSLTALPLATDAAADGQRWQAYSMARDGRQFAIPGGYFLGPGGPDGTGKLGALPRPTALLLDEAARFGRRPVIDATVREEARRDFSYWRVEAIFLADRITGPGGPGTPLHRDVLEATATDLLGPPQRVDDVLLWQIQ